MEFKFQIGPLVFVQITKMMKMMKVKKKTMMMKKMKMMMKLGFRDQFFF